MFKFIRNFFSRRKRVVGTPMNKDGTFQPDKRSGEDRRGIPLTHLPISTHIDIQLTPAQEEQSKSHLPVIYISEDQWKYEEDE